MEQTRPTITAEQETERKPYAAPTLIDFGSCAEITQGTLMGVGADSGIYS